MKILTLSTHGEVCGIASYNDRLTEALRALGHHVDVWPIDTWSLGHVPKHHIGGYFQSFLQRADAHDAVIVQHEFSLYGGAYGVRTSNAIFGQLTSAIGRSARPCAVILHTNPPGTPVGWRKRFSHQGRIAAGWARVVKSIETAPRMFAVVHGQDARRRLADWRLSLGKIEAVPMPLPPTPTSSPGFEAPRPETQPIILTIFGFIGRYKGYESALGALRLLPPRYRLIIAGGLHPRDTGSKDLEAVLATIAEHDLGDRVEVTGYLSHENVAEVFRKTDLVLAPYTDAGPTGSSAVAAGIASGRPVIASRIPAFLEIAHESDCVELVTAGAPRELAATIIRLMGDPARRDALVARAAQFARDHSWSEFAERLARRLERPGEVTRIR